MLFLSPSCVLIKGNAKFIRKRLSRWQKASLSVAMSICASQNQRWPHLPQQTWELQSWIPQQLQWRLNTYRVNSQPAFPPEPQGTWCIVPLFCSPLHSFCLLSTLMLITCWPLVQIAPPAVLLVIAREALGLKHLAFNTCPIVSSLYDFHWLP